jgi:hypothetical protein
MPGWSGANVQFYQALDVKNITLLDYRSTVSVFCNRNYVEKMWEVKEQLELTTNGGASKQTKKQAIN